MSAKLRSDALAVIVAVAFVLYSDVSWLKAKQKFWPSVTPAWQTMLPSQLARIAASSPQRRDAMAFGTVAILKYKCGQVISYPCARTTAKSR